VSGSYTPIEDLDFFRLFDELSDWCWDNVETWSALAQRTFGEQLIRAADSVPANLVEGDGRYGTLDAIRFFVIARASARETRQWIRKGIKRRMIGPHEGELRLQQLAKAVMLLNNFIKYRRSTLNTIKEERATYDGGDPFIERL
jgi:four helix bundle protein